MANLLLAPAKPNLIVDPGLRDHIIFDTAAFHDMARDSGQPEEEIATPIQHTLQPRSVMR